MSITFLPEHLDGPELNVSNTNAADIMRWLGYNNDELPSSINAADLAARCRRRLWPEARNHDAGRETRVDARPGRAAMIDCARPAGYLRQRTEQLLVIAQAAGGGRVMLF